MQTSFPNPICAPIVVAISDSEIIECNSAPGRPEDVIVVGGTSETFLLRHHAFALGSHVASPRDVF